MNRQEAKQVLLAYRPDRDDQDDEVRQALALAREDAELQQWFTQHLAFQEAVRSKLREIPVPAGLRDRILAQRKIVRPRVHWFNWQPLAAAAAAVLLLAALGAFMWLTPSRTPNGFDNFRARMVSTVLREYRMDLVTSDMSKLRQFMATKGSPADYQVPPGLQRLTLTGGGILKWRNNPVSMVCFDRGDSQMLFLFVMDKAALKDPPPPAPRVGDMRRLATVSWSSGDKAYVLAGPDEPDFAQKYL